jgi:hypothetical protein
MKKSSNRQNAFFSRRVSATLVGAATCLTATATLFAFFRPENPAKAPDRALSFEQRVNYQRAIEQVYWRHRIWPKERRDLKPPLEAVTSAQQIKTKVRDYLRNSRVLEDYWHQPISSEQLQAEMERMARHTRNPEMLRKLFNALHNDPFVIAECLTRPALSERLVNEFDETNRAPGGEPMARRQTSLQTHSVDGERDPAPVFTGYSVPAVTNTANTCADEWS